jgi:hypothetical protein
MRRIVFAVVVIALAACGGREAAEPAQPKDDPARGVYNYDHARAVGIRVEPVPPADLVCPTNVADDGFSADELDTPQERAELEREMATAPTCTVDPRLGLIVVGYSVEAVRDAGGAFEKGRLICGGIALTVPALDAEGFDDLARDRLRTAYGVDPFDSAVALVAGCRSTPWGADMLLPD